MVTGQTPPGHSSGMATTRRAGDAAVSEAEIIAYCKERLAGYKAPTSVEFRDAIPRTATGKVQKFKLREPYWAGRDREVN